MKRLFVVVFGVFITASGGASAQDTKTAPDNFDWSACKTELAKWCGSATGNEPTYLCLAQHDEDLSKTCDATHTKYEDATGRTEHINQ